MSSITLKQAAKIVSLTEDELMFLHQNGTIEAGVDQDTLAWKFNLNEVLDLKAKLDEDREEEKEENAE